MTARFLAGMAVGYALHRLRVTVEEAFVLLAHVGEVD